MSAKPACAIFCAGLATQAAAQDIATGVELFNATCAHCHGGNAQGGNAQGGTLGPSILQRVSVDSDEYDWGICGCKRATAVRAGPVSWRRWGILGRLPGAFSRQVSGDAAPTGAGALGFGSLHWGRAGLCIPGLTLHFNPRVLGVLQQAPEQRRVYQVCQRRHIDGTAGRARGPVRQSRRRAGQRYDRPRTARIARVLHSGLLIRLPRRVPPDSRHPRAQVENGPILRTYSGSWSGLIPSKFFFISHLAIPRELALHGYWTLPDSGAFPPV